jgi:ATP/maltotriose-dependent transcriptional regulator MalT
MLIAGDHPAVRDGLTGRSAIPGVRGYRRDRLRTPAWEPLSQREREVLELVAADTTNNEAAARLFICEATGKTHLLHIYARLAVSDMQLPSPRSSTLGLL